MRAEFEWAISDPDEDGFVTVRERLCGTDLINFYGPIPRPIAESVIKARRAFVHRFVTSRTQAVQIFEPRPLLANLLANSKGTRH